MEEKTVSQLAKAVDEGEEIEASVDGVIIDVKAESGLIFICPECERVLKKGKCPQHGDIDIEKAEPDLRLKCILDDGTGAMVLRGDTEITEELLDMSVDEAVELCKDQLDQRAARYRLEDGVIAEPFTVEGIVTSDEYGLTMHAEEIEQTERE